MQRWGIGIPPSLSMQAIVALAQDAEKTGAESVWVADIGRDIFTTFMLAGTEEECRSRVKAWSGCADVLSFRHTYFDPTIPREALPVAYQSLFRFAQLL